MTREVCARKAVAAMTAEKFTFAEVDKDGNAWGFSDKASVAVLSFPHPDGVSVVIFAASRDNDEAGRLRNAIRTHVFDGEDDPATPKRVGDPSAARKAPVLRWKAEQKPAAPLLRFFPAAAGIAMEKQGIAAINSDRIMAFGCAPDRSAVAFIVPGNNGVTVHVLTAVTHDKDDTAQTAADGLCERLVKILFE